MTWSIVISYLLASLLMPVFELRLGEEEPLVQSKEPFVVSPRFCGEVGPACEVIPTPC